MSTYTLFASDVSQTSPKLKKGLIRIFSSTAVYWAIGENPTARSTGSALLRGGDSIELKLPVKCSSLSVLAVNEPGTVSILELGVTRPSCSS